MQFHRNQGAIAAGLRRVTEPFPYALTLRAIEAQGPSGPVALALVKLGTAKDAKRGLVKLNAAVTECIASLDRKARAIP